MKEKKEIERILKELTYFVANEGETLEIIKKILKEIDFIFAKGKLALEMNATKPILNHNGYINIKKKQDIHF